MISKIFERTYLTGRFLLLMLHILFGLPTDLAVEVVSNWVGVVGSVRIDTACCSSVARTKFDKILARCVFRLPLHRHVVTNKLVAWCNKRNVCVDTLSVNDESDPASYENFLVRGGASLKTFRIQFQGFTYIAKTVLGLISSHCPLLENLELEGDGEGIMLGTELRDVLVNCPVLKGLFLSSTHFANFDPTNLQGITCPCLKKIQLVYIKCAEVVAACLSVATHLESISLLYCSFRLANGGNALDCISPKVISLELVEATDAELIRIINLCPLITSVNLSDEDSVLSSRSIKYLANHLTNLTAINLSFCAFDDSCLATVAGRFSRTLTSLDIVHCYGFDIATINAALNQCNNITHFGCHYNDQCESLDFSLLANATDLYFAIDCGSSRLLASIALHCKHLTTLSLDNVDENTSIDCLDSLVSNCLRICSLKIFRVPDCDGSKLLSPEKLKEWSIVRPRLVVTESIMHLDLF